MAASDSQGTPMDDVTNVALLKEAFKNIAGYDWGTLARIGNWGEASKNIAHANTGRRLARFGNWENWGQVFKNLRGLILG